MTNRLFIIHRKAIFSHKLNFIVEKLYKIVACEDFLVTFAFERRAEPKTKQIHRVSAAPTEPIDYGKTYAARRRAHALFLGTRAAVRP